MTARAPTAADRPGWGVYIAIVVVTFLTAAIGAFASLDAKEFYGSLNQPAWAPPPTVFGPVWSVLFTMMAVAACLVVKHAGLQASMPALRLYGLQLVLNAIWTWLFFHWHTGALALAEVLLLLAAVIATARAFWAWRPLAGALLLPYAAWVAFASALTLAMWRLNLAVL